jgi:hypothetical protein
LTGWTLEPTTACPRAGACSRCLTLGGTRFSERPRRWRTSTRTTWPGRRYCFSLRVHGPDDDDRFQRRDRGDVLQPVSLQGCVLPPAPAREHLLSHFTARNRGFRGDGHPSDPVPNVWYWFRIWVQDTGVRTEILAKVWQEGQAEPADWQVNAYDDTPTRLVSGTFGVWSYLSGSKYWDDLSVYP